ncbi:Ctr copper transporter family protein [Cooperia oncophora]
MLVFMTFSVWLGIAVCVGAGYVFSCFAVALIAAFYEIVKLGRLGIERTVNEQHLCACDTSIGSLHGSTVVPGMPCGIADGHRKAESPLLLSNLKRPLHMLSSTIYFVQMFIAYALMMISMTYNVPIFLSLILGHTIAYFLLGPLISVQEYEKLGDCCA